MLEEFKKFILKGNVVDLSTGVIIGGAFGNIVTGFTKGVVEPILALFGGGPNPDFKIEIAKRMVKVPSLNEKGEQIKDAAGEAVMKTVEKVIALDIGSIIGALIGFLITAAVIFFVIVKPANKLIAMMKAKEAAAPPPAPADDVKLLTEIRDLLKK